MTIKEYFQLIIRNNRQYLSGCPDQARSPPKESMVDFERSQLAKAHQDGRKFSGKSAELVMDKRTVDYWRHERMYSTLLPFSNIIRVQVGYDRRREKGCKLF